MKNIKISDLKQYAEKPDKPESRQMPLFVPMEQVGTMLEGGKQVPVHTQHTYTRGQVVTDLVADTGRGGGLGSGYKAYFYAIVCLVLILFFYQVNLYVAALLAYAFGYFWSERLFAPFWNMTWFKGKMLYYTK